MTESLPKRKQPTTTDCKEGDWESWIIFILEGIEQTSRETIEKVRKIKALLDETVETVKERLPKIYSKELDCVKIKQTNSFINTKLLAVLKE